MVFKKILLPEPDISLSYRHFPIRIDCHNYLKQRHTEEHMKPINHPVAVAVGHVCSDTLCVLDGFPKENTSNRIQDTDRQSGGGASQAIVAFARLGGNAGYLGVLGDDSNGDFVFEGLQQEHVDTSHVVRAHGQNAFSIVCVNRNNASRTLINYHDRLPALAFSQDQVEYICGATYLHLDGSKYENAIRAAHIAKQGKVTVSLDGSSMQKDNKLNIDLAKLADILIMNEVYPCRLMEDNNRERALLEIAKWGAEVVVSTSGEEGCLAVVDGKVISFPAYRVEAIDTTGAGDVFHGAFLRACDLQYPFHEAIRFSSAVSAINCMSLGGRRGIPSLHQTLQFMAEHEFHR